MGFVYVIHNESEHGSLNLFKVGFVESRARLLKRCKELRTTGVVGDYTLCRAWEFDDEISIKRIETSVHLKLHTRRFTLDREFFYGPKDELISIIEGTFSFLEISAVVVEDGASIEQFLRLNEKKLGPSRRHRQQTSSDDFCAMLDDFEFLDAQATRPLQAYVNTKNHSVGVSRVYMGWCRAIYWLSPLLAESSRSLTIGLPEEENLTICGIPSVGDASRLIEFEARIMEERMAFAACDPISRESQFCMVLCGANRMTHLPSIVPGYLRRKGFGSTEPSCIGRLNDDYCYEIGLKEGTGAPYFDLSHPLPLDLCLQIEDPVLRIWVRCLWQLLTLRETDRSIWALAMPGQSGADAWIAHAIQVLTTLGYKFSDANVRSASMMWSRPMNTHAPSSCATA